jgi:hypothetical protein
MAHRGKYIVLAVLLLAVLLAVGNMAYQTWSARRAIAHWGHDAAQLILTAPRVDVLRLRSSSLPLDAAATVDATHARGLLHVRRGLVNDALYAWDSPPVNPTWHYALRFRDGDAECTLLLDSQCLTMAAFDNPDRPLSIRRNESGASPLLKFIEEQVAQSTAKER